MPPATILHLSDLHLGENLDDTGRADYGTLGSAFRGGSPIMQSHDSYVVATLPTEITAAARTMGSETDDFDFTVVTGDISTSADSDDRFAFARRFFLERFPGAGGWTFGLGLPAGRTLCVPGNHDKMLERTLDRYLAGFGTLPATPPYAVARRARNGTAVIFYGLDSNDYSKGNMAIGEISPTTLAWLGEQLKDVEPRREPGGPLRILLLHHHPCDLNRFRRRSLKQRLLDRAVLTRLTRLEEGDRLLDQCRGRIDVIMHGHEHFPVVFTDEQSGCLVISAGSTSEFHGASRSNSFHGLAVDAATIRVRQFDWTGARFAPGREWTYERANGVLTEPVEERTSTRARLRAALRWLNR